MNIKNINHYFVLYRGVVEAVMEKINEAIANHFDINALSISPNLICIVDLGCSTGSNTFIAMQNIVEPSYYTLFISIENFV